MAVVVKTNVLVDDTLRAWRASLVRNHHVLGVISLPPELFYPTAVPTVILVVKAHVSTNRLDTLLARIENDGYQISKKRRVSREGSQLPQILDIFSGSFERGCIDTVPNIACSVGRKMIADGDEICAERWLPSQEFGPAEFEQHRAESTRQMSLAVANYPDIIDELIEDYEELLAAMPTDGRPGIRARLSEWFSVSAGKSSGEKNYPDGTVPYISSGDAFNSIVSLVHPADEEIIDNPCISLTGFGQACIQPWRFCARGNGGSAVRILIPRFGMSLAELMWFVGQINSQRWRFHYGRMAVASRIRQLELDPPPQELPVLSGMSARLRNFHIGLAALSTQLPATPVASLHD
jgi:hypothetical protein